MIKRRILVKTLAVVMTTTAFSSFILEEAIQTMGFGLWILKDSPYLARYLDTCFTFDRGVEKIYWCFLPLNPLFGWIYILYVNADLLKLEAYRASLAPGG